MVTSPPETSWGSLPQGPTGKLPFLGKGHKTLCALPQ